MKKILPFAFLLLPLLCGCSCPQQKTKLSQEQRDYCEQRKECPTCEHFNSAILFDDDCCIKEEYFDIVKDDMECIDKNKDGCASRKEYDDFMSYWAKHTPESGISLCEQYRAHVKNSNRLRAPNRHKPYI